MSAVTTSNYASSDQGRSYRNLHRSPTWSLLLKECRQTVPLFVALLGIAIMLHLLGAMNASLYSRQSNFHIAVHQSALILMPALFAIGVGSVLVSQEKEQRTMLWLSSMPIPPKRIVLFKALVGLVGLILFWIINGVIGFSFCPEILDRSNLGLFSGSFSLGIYVTNSFLLLVASFACAWIFDSAWGALIALVFIAGIAFLSAYGVSELVDAKLLRGDNASQILFIVSLFTTLFFGILTAGAGYYFGRRTFVAPSGSPEFTIAAPAIPNSLRGDPSNQWQSKSVASSLLWQIGNQNSMTWIAGGGGILLLLMCLTESDVLIGFSTIVAGLLVSWLGASTFGSDSTKGRIRFLADRGIAPATVWWTRMLLPAAILSVGLIGATAIIMTTNELRTALPTHRGLLSLGVGLAFLLIFSATQWSSLWMRSSFLALCLAPGVAIAILAYSLFVQNAFQPYPVLLLGTAIVMLLASRIMMRAWMDGRTGYRVAFQHLGFGTLALAIPLIPTLWIVATYPTLSRATHHQLMAIAGGQVARSGSNPVLLKTVEQINALPSGGVVDGATSSIAPSAGESNLDLLLDGLEYQLNNSGDPKIESSTRNFLKGELVLTSLALATDGKDDATKNALKARFARLIQLNVRVAEMDRRSGFLDRSELADATEKRLVEELSKPLARTTLGDENFHEISSKLADRKARNDARRKAIAYAWREQVNGKARLATFGGVQVSRSRNLGLMANSLALKRRAGLAAETLLQFLDSGNRQPENPAFKRYSQFWETDRIVSPKYAVYGEGITIPGLQWHGEWETRAEELLSNSKNP